MIVYAARYILVQKLKYRLALQHAIMELEQVQDEMQHNQENVEGKCAYAVMCVTLCVCVCACVRACVCVDINLKDIL